VRSQSNSFKVLRTGRVYLAVLDTYLLVYGRMDSAKKDQAHRDSSVFV
jgi:hypothetical protein